MKKIFLIPILFLFGCDATIVVPSWYIKYSIEMCRTHQGLSHLMIRYQDLDYSNMNFAVCNDGYKFNFNLRTEALPAEAMP